MANNYQAILKVIQDAEDDFTKFYDKGIGAAGTRVRKALQELATLAKEGRKDVTETKNARKEAPAA